MNFDPRALFKKIVLCVFAIAFMFAVVFLAKTLPKDSSIQTDTSLSKQEQTTLPSFVQQPGSLQLLVEPDNGTGPIIKLINNAKQSVTVTLYQFDDADISNALIAAQKRGVSVRVLLNPGYKSEILPIQVATKQKLESGGVLVHYTPKRFALTHQKTICIDNQACLIMTFNWVSKYYATGRDFGILDNDPNDVTAIINTFNADWNDKNITAQNGNDVIWSPGAETAMINTIRLAKKTLDVYNEEMADDNITDELIAAEGRGVDVRVTMTYSTNWKPSFIKLANAGVNLRTYANGKNHIYIHAKMILADDAFAYVGSQNFSYYSLEKNRELGIFVTDTKVLSQLESTFEKDYSNARIYNAPK